MSLTDSLIAEVQKAADMAILSNAVLIFGPCTVRNRNREHYAVRSVLLTLWSKHRSDRIQGVPEKSWFLNFK